MVVMVLCGLALLAGTAAVVRWGGEVLARPWQDGGAAPAGLVVRRYVWHVAVGVGAGVAAGVLVAGAGGRLIMRLLAVTAGDAAQGGRTEADEIVGRITAGGTLSFILFTALLAGLTTGPLYLLIRRWLPRGRLGGLAFGALLLAAGATRVDPLRAGNADFELVGPGWLSVTAFAALVLLHGMLVAALAARYSRVLPLIARNRGAVLRHAPLLVLIGVAPVIALLALGALVVVVLGRVGAVAAALRSRAMLVGGRVVLAAVAVAALPGAIVAVAAIAGD